MRKDEPNDFYLSRMVTEKRLGNLIGQVKEIIEASIQDKEQRTALKNIITDKFYEWFGDIGEKLSEEEVSVALGKHWEGITSSNTAGLDEKDIKIIN